MRCTNDLLVTVSSSLLPINEITVDATLANIVSGSLTTQSSIATSNGPAEAATATAFTNTIATVFADSHCQSRSLACSNYESSVCIEVKFDAQ